MKSILREKSYAFALRIVKLSRHLQMERKEYVLSRQLLRSGTAIDALVSEARYAQSRKDFINKLSIALKEASETEFWIRLHRDAGYIDSKVCQSLSSDITVILKLLTASINTAKKQNV